MFDNNKVIQGLTPLIAFRQSKTPDVPYLPKDLTTSDINSFFEDYYPMCTTTNLYSIFSNYNVEYHDKMFDSNRSYSLRDIVVSSFGLDTYVFQSYIDNNNDSVILTPLLDSISDFSINSTYNLDDYIISNRYVYKSLQDNNTGNTPPIVGDTSLFWVLIPWVAIRLIPSFEDILREKRIASINRVLTDKAIRVKLNRVTKSLLSETNLFHGYPDRDNPEEKSGRMIGLRFFVKHFENLKATIHKLGLMFSEPQNDLPIYLFHTSQYEPLLQTTVTTTAVNGSNEWLDLNWVFNYHDNTHDVGGSFYLCYFEDDLTGNAINKRYNRGTLLNTDYWGLGSSGDNYFYYPYTLSDDLELFNVYPFYVEREYLRGRNLPELGTDDINVRYISSFSKTYGFNPTISIECDVSDIFIRHKDRFAKSIGLQFACDINEEIIKSIQRNSDAEDLRDPAQLESDKDVRHQSKSIYKQLELELKALDFDFSELNAVCLPCNKKYGIKRSNA